MFTHHTVSEQRGTAEISLALLQEIFSDYHPRNFAVRLWDGTFWEPDPGERADFTFVIRHPGALRSMFLHPSQVAIGEAYIHDEIDIEGDLAAAFQMASYIVNLHIGIAEKVHLANLLRRLPANGHASAGRAAIELKGALHSKERDRQAVTYHYDVSNDFFSLWLDPWMMYSCAYFTAPDQSLEQAQEQKLEYICRKLDLRPGERLLDIGCGWGGLVCYAARRFGVAATGITLSEPQADFANERIEREGLHAVCSVKVRDYRDMDRTEAYDKIVSVGMFEHVGAPMLPEYFERAFRMLKPGGRFLNHGIGTTFNHVERNGDSFSDKYIFPDSEVLPISTTLHAAETRGFEVRDVESLREHYMMTLRHWLKRLEARHEQAVRATDESIYRTWRLNHAGAALGFEQGRNSLYQTLLVRPIKGQSLMPLTRSAWYV